MPVIEAFTPRKLGNKPWGEEWLVAHTPHYTGKVMLMRAGGTGALQYHVQKDEAFYLFSGLATVEYASEDGELHQIEMSPGMAFHIPPGAVHRVEAITDSVFFEASTPHFDDRVKV